MVDLSRLGTVVLPSKAEPLFRIFELISETRDLHSRLVFLGEQIRSCLLRRADRDTLSDLYADLATPGVRRGASWTASQRSRHAAADLSRAPFCSQRYEENENEPEGTKGNDSAHNGLY